MAFKNTTRQPLAFPKKGGGFVDIRPDETTTEALDMDSAQVKGALLSGVLAEGPKRELAAPPPPIEASSGVRTRAPKPE